MNYIRISTIKLSYRLVFIGNLLKFIIILIYLNYIYKNMINKFSNCPIEMSL